MDPNKLDKFFKDRLEQRSFEWKEEHWVSALEVLEEATPSRRRRPLLWWLVLGSLVLSGGIIGMVWAWSGQTDTTPLGSFFDRVEFPERTTAVHSETTSVSGSVPVEEALLENAASPIPETPEQGVSSPKKTGITDLPVAEKEPEAIGSTSKFDLQRQPLATHPTDQAGNGPDLTEEPSANVTSLPLLGSVSDEPTLPRRNFFLLLPLPVHLLRVVLPDSELLTRQTTALATIEPMKVQSPWRLGIRANAGWLQDVQADSLLFQHGVHLLLNRQLFPRWHLRAGIGWQRIRARYDSLSEVSQQAILRFGLDANQLVLRPTALHQVVVPMGIQRQWKGGHGVELGLEAAYQLGVYGTLYEEDQLFPWERSETQQEAQTRQLLAYYQGGEEEFKPIFRASSPVASGWVDLPDVRKFQLTAYFGYQYRFGAFAADLRVQYRPFSVYQSQKGWNQGGVGTQIGLTYWIF